MKLRNAVMAAAMVAATCGIEAQTTVKRTYATPTARFASAIWAGDTLYVAGQMGSPVTPEDKAKGTPADRPRARSRM
jgi:enamine deaminase RidA (YjgF/YER057c/UK114 family)